jgi:hypothetical protein
MPGMSICAYTGAAVSRAIVEQSSRGRIFTKAQRYGKAPPAGGRGRVRSAIAILAGAGVATAAGFGGAAALAILSGSLAVGHSNSPFSRCSKRANHHIASVPWYRVKQPNR